MVSYRATLGVPRALVQHVSYLLAAERRRVGTRRGTWALTPFGQAVVVLRWFGDGTRVDQLARDAGIGVSTAYRYLHEGIDVLAAAAPDLHEVLEVCRAAGLSHVILDGTLVGTDRVAERSETGNDAWYSGKHHTHGGNVQFLATPDGFPL